VALNQPHIDLREALIFALGKGRSPLDQLKDIVRVVRTGHKMTPQEYYYFGLFDPELYNDEERSRFLSDNYHQVSSIKTCDVTWRAIHDDKLISQMVLESNGAPVPRIEAVVHPFRRFPNAPTLTSPDETARWLRTDAVFPLFSKPVTGVQSMGQAIIDGIDTEADVLQLRKSEPTPVEDFVREVWEFRGTSSNDGHIFQELLRPHPELLDLCGPGIGGLRVITQLEKDGPRITHTTWKIVTGGNIADNFWREGNMVGHVDPLTGEVLRIVRGTGIHIQVVTEHPDTGKNLLGVTLPDWEEMRNLVLECSALVPKVRLQGWDIALCDRGPVIVEANAGTGFRLHQLSSGKGLMTPEFRKFLDRSAEALQADRRPALKLESANGKF
jgi:hypothetical protein